jgi:SAM-dependent methyltransferase
LPKQSLLGSIAGAYTAEILLQLKRLKILSELKRWQTANEISKKFACDPSILGILLEFLSQNSVVIQRSQGGSYRINPRSGNMSEVTFCLEKFMGAYGRTLRNIGTILRSQGAVRKILDERALASAFGDLGIIATPVIPDVMARQGIRCVLDLACGPGSLLIELGSRNKKFRGYGVDSSSAMCRIAKSRIHRLKFSNRICIRRGDARNIEHCFAAAEIREIEAVHARSLLNEFFRGGSREVVRLLRGLRRVLPGRIAWFVDYYGRLGWDLPVNRELLYTSLHDVVQSVSRQGIPPPDVRAWKRIYADSGCKLLEALEFKSDGIHWFIHNVRL